MGRHAAGGPTAQNSGRQVGRGLEYTTVDLGLRLAPGGQPWDLAFSVRSLFDAEAREPSFAPGSIPFDFPTPRRSYRLRLGYRI